MNPIVTETSKIQKVRSLGQPSLEMLEDVLAVEEPLEIRLKGRSISITMRTPGHDFELAAGFLFTEGIVQDPRDIASIRFCGPAQPNGQPSNVVSIELKPEVSVDVERLKRHFYTSSSCGVCGKSSIEALHTQSRFDGSKSDLTFRASVIHRLPSVLRNSQAVFDSTGGLHASAIFSPDGSLLSVREDVGRHNALDKLIGDAFLRGQLPLSDCGLLVSGRASFELIQKAAMAGICFFMAVGAPSSLAVALAREADMTLLGFVRDDRFNIYHGARRVRMDEGN